MKPTDEHLTDEDIFGVPGYDEDPEGREVKPMETDVPYCFTLTPQEFEYIQRGLADGHRLSFLIYELYPELKAHKWYIKGTHIVVTQIPSESHDGIG